MPIRSILTRFSGVFAAVSVVVTLWFAVPAGADSYDRTVTVINGTGATLVQLYGSAGGGWGSNRLRGGAIPPNGSASINFDDGSGQCRFNVKAVFADGTQLQNNNVDVCQSRSFRFR